MGSCRPVCAVARITVFFLKILMNIKNVKIRKNGRGRNFRHNFCTQATSVVGDSENAHHSLIPAQLTSCGRYWRTCRALVPCMCCFICDER